MKNRNLFNNIFTVTIMASLVLFLLSYFQVFGNETLEGWIQKITLPLAMASAVCMEIVLPVLDNKELFKTDKKMKIKFAVKVVLVIAAIVPLVMNISGTLNQSSTSEFGVLAAFVILYMAQFFINLDPPSEEEEDEDEEYEDDEDYEDDEEESEVEENEEPQATEEEKTEADDIEE